MYKLLPILALLLCDISFAQEFSYNAKQATFLEAESAKLYQSDKGVLLSVIGLNPERKVGVELTVEGLTEPEIEVTRLIEFQGITVGVYPPNQLKPTEGVYLILGKPGERYGVRARTTEGIKHFVVVLEGVEEPDVPTDPDPPQSGNLTQADLDSVTTLVSASVATLKDPITTRYISAALEKVSLSEVLGEAAVELKEAIGNALVDSMKEVRPPYKDWESNFRKPLEAKITELVTAKKVVNGSDLQQVVKAMVKGMSTTSSLSRATIKIYYRENCNLCTKWETEVFPSLKAVGWALDKVYEPTATVPKFVICDNNKCSKEIVGYLDIPTLKLYLEGMR
jgi:hypothetical protein